MKRIFTTGLLALVAAVAGAQTVIPLHPESDGRYTMNASVNGVGVRTYYTPDKWYASMSTTTYLFLYDGKLTSLDINSLKSLRTLEVSHNSLTSLSVSGALANCLWAYLETEALPEAQLSAAQRVLLLFLEPPVDAQAEVQRAQIREQIDGDVIARIADDVAVPPGFVEWLVTGE